MTVKKSTSADRRASGNPNWKDKVGVNGGEWSKTDPAGPVKGLRRAQIDAGQHWGGKASDKLAARIPQLAPMLGKYGARALPFVGTAIGAAVFVHEVNQHDWVGAGIALVSMVPGPIGWLGLGLDAVYGIYGPETGTALDAPPGISGAHTTYMLPIAAVEVAGVPKADDAVTKAQRAVFGFQDGENGPVWREPAPNALALNTPGVQAVLTKWLRDISDTFKQINNELISRNEPYMEKAQQHLQAHLGAMAKMPDNAALITTQLAAASTAAGSWYAAVLEANSDARTALSQGSDAVNDPSSNLAQAQNQNQTAIANADTKLQDVGAGDSLGSLAPPPRLAPPQRTTPGAPPADLPQMPQIAPAAPLTPTAPLAPAAAADKKKDDISDILSKLGNNLGGSPMGGGMPMGGMPMGGQPLGGGTPLAQPTPKPLAPEPKPVLATERKNLAGTPVENKVVPAAAEKKVDTAAAEKKDAPVVGAAAAANPSEPTIKPAASTKSAPDHTVDVKGKKITFPDAKTATLATELGKSAPGSPASLADAATKAGLVPPVAGQDPGQQVAPANAKPGDLLVAGDKSYMNLGDGNFLDYSNGKVVDADQMSKDLGPKGGYFHLVDAAAGAQPGPVSGQTPDTTTFTVADSAKVPVDAGAAAAPAPAPVGPAPAGGSTPAGVTSAGSPGVPAQGAPGSGPANAAATDTGRGVGTLASGQKPLDPTAIK
jgi:hypothetical protein